jgi:hypothetical protein
MVSHESNLVDIGWNVSPFTGRPSVELRSLITSSRTTFFSVIFAIANSLRLQGESHGRSASGLLT